MTAPDDGTRLLGAYRSVTGPDAEASARAWAALARRAVAGDVVELEPEVIASRSHAWIFAAAAVAVLTAGIGFSLVAHSTTERQGGGFEQAAHGSNEAAQAPITTTLPVDDHPREVTSAVAPRVATLPDPVPETVAAPIAPMPRTRGLRPKAIADAPPSITPPPQPEASIDAAEITALRRAQGLVARDPTQALTLLERHANDYPRSSLVGERSIARITALCNLGRVQDSRQAAADFAHAHPASPLLARVRSACSNPTKLDGAQTDPRTGGMD